ncbi:ABC transporter ATP-binding protein [bacterium]|nr:ABC transporter ATP-binding protein [bacterium]
MSDKLIEVQDLVVEYGKGAKKVRAVDGISFDVERGEVVGFVGPNGAGKSTTIKTLMGFIFPLSGTVKIFGSQAGTVESRRRLGYLPEVALYYPFMKARELLALYGGLQGLSRAELKSRIPELLEEVGLGGKGNVLLRNFSKGMQQRLGIAQAIIARPELLVFDEMSSGLDPVGRHDLREVLLKLRQQGTTIFFSSHELVEVEELCDRVIMVNRGKIVTSDTVANLMKPMNCFEIVFELDGDMPTELGKHSVEERGNQRVVSIAGVEDYTKALSALSSAGARLISTESKTQSLEEYFISLIRHEPEKVAATA